jgi:four helix bundle protein
MAIAMCGRMDEPRSRTIHNPDYAHGADIRNRAMAFASRAVALYEHLIARGSAAARLAGQVMDAASSGHSSLEEAQGGESDADFISKMCVGLKEFREAHGRLQVLQRETLGPDQAVAELCDEALQIVRIVSAIIASKRRNCGIDPRERRPTGRRRRSDQTPKRDRP